MKKMLISSAVLLGTLSTGCGGGGGGGTAMQSSRPQNLESAPAPAEPFNIPSATLTANSGNNAYTAFYHRTPNNGTAMFDGQEANSSSISLIIKQNGLPIAGEIETAYYLENPYQPLGLTISLLGGGPEFGFLYNSTDPLPSTLTVGGSGPLGSGTFYSGIGSLTETYSVASNDASTVLLTTHATGTVDGQSLSETFNYAVNASGAFELLSIEIPVYGATVKFTNSCSGCWDY
jgi:hypothetical protein